MATGRSGAAAPSMPEPQRLAALRPPAQSEALRQMDQDVFRLEGSAPRLALFLSPQGEGEGRGGVPLFLLCWLDR